MKIDKKILIGLMIVNLYTFIMDSLTIMSITKMTDYHARTFNIFYSLAASLAILSLIKHKYWILAGVFGLLHSISRIAAAFLFTMLHDIYNKPTLSIIVMGLLSTLTSTYYYFKLFKINDFSFEDNIRLKGLDDYFKKTFRRHN